MKKNRISLLITLIALVAIVPLTTFAQGEQGERPPVPRDVAEAETAKSKGLIQLAEQTQTEFATGKRGSNPSATTSKMNASYDPYFSTPSCLPSETEINGTPVQKPGACLAHSIGVPIKKNTNPDGTPAADPNKSATGTDIPK